MGHAPALFPQPPSCGSSCLVHLTICIYASFHVQDALHQAILQSNINKVVIVKLGSHLVEKSEKKYGAFLSNKPLNASKYRL